MELVLIGAVAFLASGLTLFSGFGLGTILMPTFALFFPVPLAVAATAVVHFVNNVLKFGLMAKEADRRVVARFGLPATAAAVGGAALLGAFDHVPALATYALGSSTREVTAVKAVIGGLIVVFALLESWPRFHAFSISPRWLPLGGILSGFFGGLSGNQGALRSAFLVKCGLSKEAFIATGVVTSVMVDAARLAVYGTDVLAGHVVDARGVAVPVALAIACAFAGVVVGRRVLHRVTLRAVRMVVAAAMLLIGLALATGLV